MQALIKSTYKQRIHNLDSVKYSFYIVDIKAISIISVYIMITFSV